MSYGGRHDVFTDSNNMIHISGKITESLVFDHESYGEKFYSTVLSVIRTSGSEDMLRLCISERFIKDNYEYKDRFAVVDGEIRTYRLREKDGSSHVMVYAFVKSFYVVDENTNENKVRLNGFICKALPPRKTPKGKQISDIILAVNRDFGKSDYIPCVCWGYKATEAYEAGVGAEIDLVDRFQSRPIKNGTRLVFEISVGNLRIVG